MKERSFIDTNILIYTDDKSQPEKQRIGLELLKSGWETGNLVFSTQVLQEYFVAATKKLGLEASLAQQKIRILTSQEIQLIESGDISRAIELHRLYGYSFWDSLIITTAVKSSCTVLYSEDMQAGQKIDGLKIINPFQV